MLPDGPGHTGAVLEPLVAGAVERVGEAVPDDGGGGDAELVAAVLEPDPQFDVLTGTEVVIETNGQQHLAAHQRGADTEPRADPAVVVVPCQGGAPVAGAVGLAGQAELQAVVGAVVELAQQPLEGARGQHDVGVNQRHDLAAGILDAQHPRGRQAAALVGEDAGPERPRNAGSVVE